MRRTLTFIVIILSLKSYAKNHKKTSDTPLLTTTIPKAIIDTNSFKGVGILKIGSDTSTLINYANQKSLEIKDCISMLYLHNTLKRGLPHLLRLKNDTSIYRFIDLSNNPDVSEYSLSSYSVSGITIKGIRLKYYKNSLISVISRDEIGVLSLLSPMEQKYGKPKISVSKKELDCIYNSTGITRKLEDKIYTYDWSSSYADCWLMFGHKHDDKCKENNFVLFKYGIENKELSEWEIKNKKSKPKKDLSDF